MDDIAKELEGKNPKIVLPQAKKMMTLQRQRFTLYLIGSFVTAFLGIGGFVIEQIPNVIKYISLFLLPFQILGVFGDYHLYEYQKKKVDFIEKNWFDCKKR